MSNSSPKGPRSPRPDAKSERNNQIAKFYLAGLSQYQLADIHGITKGRVREILVNCLGEKTMAEHLEAKKQQRNLQRAQREAAADKKRTTLHPVKHKAKSIAWILHVCAVYESMRSQTPPALPREIAKKLGISIGMLWHSIYEKRHNVSLDFVRRISSLSEAELRTILEMRESGATFGQIGKRFQLRTQQVDLALKKARALKTN